MSKPTNLLYFLVFFLLCGSLAACASPQPPNQLRQVVSPSVSDSVIRYAVFPAPPFMIGSGTETDPMSGIDVDIANEIARRMNKQVRYISCTWERCLKLMQTGEADLLSSAYKKPDREEFMTYFAQPFLDRLPIAFYTLQKNHYRIEKYEDIYQYSNVGVLQGAGYFEKFDTDSRVKKFPVTSQDQLFPMLLAGRLDVMAGYIPTENYQISVKGYRSQIERSVFEHQEPAQVYMAVSKKSILDKKMDNLDLINNQLLAEGFVAKVIAAYYERYH